MSISEKTENLQVVEQKLTTRKKIAAIATIPAAIVGGLIGVGTGSVAKEILGEMKLQKYSNYLDAELQHLIWQYEPSYIWPYGLNIPHNPDTYLRDIEANKSAFGADYDFIYWSYDAAFTRITESMKYSGDVIPQSVALGVGAGVISFLLVAGIPTARYLMCRRKYNKLKAENEKTDLQQEELLKAE